MSLTLSSRAFRHGAPIPKRHSGEGEDLSPPLSWSGAPAGTQSYALICEDPDAPGGTWHHWAAYNIPADVTELAEGVPSEPSRAPMPQAINDMKKPGYHGPCPPKGHGTHHYHFRLFALSVRALDVPPNAHVRDVADAARAHSLAMAELTGTYSR